MDIVWRECADTVYRMWNDCGNRVGRVRVDRMFKGVGKCGGIGDIVWKTCGDSV